MAKFRGQRITNTELHWLTATLVVTLAPHWERLPIWFIPLSALAIGSRYLSQYGRLPPVPAVLRLLVTLAAAVAIAWQYGSLLGRASGVGLLCVMLILKLTESYGRRDGLATLGLCCFLAATHFLFSQSIGLLVYLIAASAMIVMTMHVFFGGQRTATAWHQLGRQHGMAAVRFLLQAAPLALVLFLLFPRLGSPLWGMPQDALEGKTGLDDTMRPGEFAELFIDDRPAMRVEFEGDNIPANSARYWRGPVLWTYDGATWTRPNREIGRRYGNSLPAASDADYRYTVTMEPSERRWMLALDFPIGRPDNQTYLARDFSMIAGKPITELKRYRLAADVDFRPDPQLDPQFRRFGLQTPPGFDPRTRALMAQWRAETPDDLALVQRTLRYFREEPFVYTMEPDDLGVNRIDDFLFVTRQGYCEHYSSVFTQMMRMAGIPARVITGFQGGWFNADAGYLLVRNSDAHAWAEVWIEGEGWLRVDPTAAVAPERIEQGAREAFGGSRGATDFDWLYRARNALDRISHAWNQWVIEFSSQRQRNLFKPLGFDDVGPGLLTAVMTAFGVVFIVAVYYWLNHRTPASNDPLRRLFAKFEARLARLGVRREMGEPPLRYTQRAALKFPRARQQILKIGQLYNAMRYSRAGSTPTRLNQLRRSIAALKLK